MKIFTGVDKALLQRGARLLEAQAKALEKATTAGGSWAGKRKEKVAFDALLRDARDLRSLAARLAKASPEPVADPRAAAAHKARVAELEKRLLDDVVSGSDSHLALEELWMLLGLGQFGQVIPGG